MTNKDLLYSTGNSTQYSVINGLYGKKDVLFTTGNWNAKVGSQEISGVTGKFGLEYRMNQGKG